MVFWQNLSLRAKINLILLGFLSGFLVISLYWQYRQHQGFVFAEAVDKARIITVEATRTRDYVSLQLQNGKVELNQDRYGLIPVVAASRISQIVARDLDYTIRHTSLRYRNAANRPDDFERAVLQRFDRDPGLSHVAEASTLNGVPVFRYLLAARVEKSCLLCHGDPRQSPEFLRRIYPPDKDSSYHYTVGQVIGAVSVVIPMNQIKAQMSARFRSTVVTTGGFFVALAICLGLLVRTSVINPLGSLATAINRIARTGDFSARLPVRSHDEIGKLVDGFNGMMQEIAAKTRQLEESEKRFRLLTEMARDAIVAFLPGGQVFLINRQAEQLFGYSQAELLGEPIDRLLVVDAAGAMGICAFLQTAGPEWFIKTHRVTGLDRGGTPVQLELTVTVVNTGERPFYTAMLRRAESNA